MIYFGHEKIWVIARLKKKYSPISECLLSQTHKYYRHELWNFKEKPIANRSQSSLIVGEHTTYLPWYFIGTKRPNYYHPMISSDHRTWRNDANNHNLAKSYYYPTISEDFWILSLALVDVIFSL